MSPPNDQSPPAPNLDLLRAASGAATASSRLAPVWTGIGLGGLLTIVLGVAAFTVFAAAGARGIAPLLDHRLPAWEAGPLGGLIARPQLPGSAVRVGISELLLVMTGAYVVVLLTARRLPLWGFGAFVVVISATVACSPPAPLNDLFNYLGYARLFAVHHLNPYLNVIAAERHDPVYALTSWRYYSSPYGPLFTALTLPVALLPLPAAYWTLKLIAVASGGALLWAIHWVCRGLGRDSRFALALVAANPIYLFYALAGFHNDLLMLVPSVLAVGMFARGRDRSAGSLVVIAAALKPTTVLLLPLMLTAARADRRWRRLLEGVLVAGVPVLAISLWLFGPVLPNVAQQSLLVTGFSVPNLVGLALGLGGVTTLLMRGCQAAVVLVVLWGMRRRDWLSSFGWATAALVVSLAWLMPWYVVWVLPFAGIAGGRALRAAALALTVFLLATFLPLAGSWATTNGLDPLATRVGLRHVALARDLQYGPRCRSVRIRRDGEVVCAQRRQQRGAQRSRRDLVRHGRADARVDLA